jgi:soluble lytic murein transglycosylase-like protein
MKSRFEIVRTGVRAAAMVALGLVAGGCSMAGLPSIAPAKTKVATVAPAPAPKREDSTIGFGPLAFAPAPATVGGPAPATAPSSVPAASHVKALISRYAATYAIPESLLHRVVRSESNYNPAARNGPFLGLMQIRYETAKSMGYKGTPLGLLDAEANLKFGAKYLRGAYLVAGYNADRAISLYRSGYYYHAKRAGLLEETGLR